jgi:hypothetical protein
MDVSLAMDKIYEFATLVGRFLNYYCHLNLYALLSFNSGLKMDWTYWSILGLLFASLFVITSIED